VSSGARLIYTNRTAAYDAKNRYNLPDSLPLSWADFFEAVERRETASATDLRLAVSGRSRTADLVDCSAVHAAGDWRNRRIDQVAADLAAAYGVEVVASSGVGAALARHTVQHGETVLDCIERAATLRGLLVTDNAAGALVLTSADAAPDSGEVLTLGDGLVLSMRVRCSLADVYSEYRCRGQRAGNDNDNGEAAAHPYGEALDVGVARTRVLVLRAEGGVDTARCAERAAWEAATRAAQSVGVTATVASWRGPRGELLWTPGTLVRARDERLGVDAVLLLVDVRFSLDDQGGERADLTLAPADGFRALAPTTATRRGFSAWRELEGGA
jgi:prophage tail gpP-like protein